MAAFETLVAVPLVLLLGLSALQWGLVFHARQSVVHAAIEGARAGSVGHASAESIERGLSRGLSPWLLGATGPQDHADNQQRAHAHLRTGMAAGWVRWRRIAPSPASFSDWAEPALDAAGQPLPGLLEIPNDNLTLRNGDRMPASGIGGWRDGEPIGIASGVTLNDANLLKLEFVYGVPLTVPLIGRVAAWIMRKVDACDPGQTGLRLGAIDLGVPLPSVSPRRWTCAFYEARGADGRQTPRWPVLTAAGARMQSPARAGADHAGLTPDAGGQTMDGRAIEALPAGGGVGLGRFDPVESPLPPARLNPGGDDAGSDGSIDRAPGFLRFGGNRLLPAPDCPSG